MQKQKENLFAKKFRLLNSQENTEEINWSSSESSDFENVSNNDRFCNITNKPQRKRKRKGKVPKNMSNLDITIIDAPKDQKEQHSANKSPILQQNKAVTLCEKYQNVSPKPMYFPPYSVKAEPSSPILTSKICSSQIKHNSLPKSPILLMKYGSPKTSPKVRKKLFTSNKTCQNTHREDTLRRMKQDENEHKYNDRRKSFLSSPNSFCVNNETSKNSGNSKSFHHLDLTTNSLQFKEDSAIAELHKDDSFETLKVSDLDLVKKVQSYFDSHFSSENTSQQSISSSLTPKHSSKTSDEIEIMSFITQVASIRASCELETKSKDISPISSQSAEMNPEKTKKIRYRKDGLAYRLNALLKKKNAHISLWQHERFLAENSNFVIPKGEHSVFRIKKVHFKYGCYLIEAVDVNEQYYLILLNGVYANNINISADNIFKLYEPYKILDFNDECKLIFNVCKFESIAF